LLRSGNCAKDRMEPPDVCAEKAAQAAQLKPKKLRKFKNTKWPAGCFLNKKGVPFYNKFLDSQVSCGRGGSKGCVCEQPVSLAPTHVYKLTRGKSCPASEKPITEKECVQKVKDLGLKVKKFVKLKDKKGKWPPGCIAHNGRAVFNRNPKPKGKFNKKRVGVCEGPWTKSKKLCKRGLVSLKDCEDAAAAVGKKFNPKKSKTIDARKWPSGCFYFNKRVWFNKSGKGRKNCGKGECLCKDR